MKGTQEKERLRLRDDGNYEFSTAEKNWIPAIRNVPEIDGMVPAGGKEQRKGRKLSETDPTAVETLNYGPEGCVQVTRTVEFRPKTRSFTVQDEFGALGEGRIVTESLCSPYPIRLTEGTAGIDADGEKATVVVRNQENIRVEKMEQPDGSGGTVSFYCLRWEAARDREYTCCQVELEEGSNSL